MYNTVIFDIGDEHADYYTSCNVGLLRLTSQSINQTFVRPYRRATIRATGRNTGETI